jgi:hypothetical protein
MIEKYGYEAFLKAGQSSNYKFPGDIQYVVM